MQIQESATTCPARKRTDVRMRVPLRPRCVMGTDATRLPKMAPRGARLAVVKVGLDTH